MIPTYGFEFIDNREQLYFATVNQFGILMDVDPVMASSKNYAKPEKFELKMVQITIDPSMLDGRAYMPLLTMDTDVDAYKVVDELTDTNSWPDFVDYLLSRLDHRSQGIQ